MDVKICGMTHREDVQHAALAGADYVGLIFSQSSKRQVSLAKAQELCQVAKNYGIEPVGVFVTEGFEEIFYIAKTLELKTIQLHGSTPKESLHILMNSFSIIYACKADEIIPSFPSITLLFDQEKEEHSLPLDLHGIHLPLGRHFWLAGGLTVDNVQEKIRQVQPHGVDVARGVETFGSLRKDPVLMSLFIQKVKQEEL